MKSVLYGILFLAFCSSINAQDEDAFFIRSVYDHSLTKSKCYDWLSYLSEDIGGRLAGSPQSIAAIEYTRQEMTSLELDDVRLQECEVPYWRRGKRSIVKIINSTTVGTVTLRSLSLGNSEGTGNKGITGQVIEVKGLDELKALNPDKVKGKIVFFNRPLDATQIRTFYAYGGAVDQRGSGPALAGRIGALGCLVRSMTTRLDDIPHTGVTVFGVDDPRIPAVAISTNDAELLSKSIANGPTSVYIENYAKMMPKQKSYNVIGEIKGSTYPDEIILVGGHLDSWDVGGGAHDDGSGCVHSMQVMANLMELNYKPKRTIRCVMFMNEENGLGGGKAYAKASNDAGEHHIAAIESDAGGFSPRGFTCDAEDDIFNTKFPNVVKWLPLLEPYGLFLQKGGSGADINPLKSQRGLLFGLRPDSQRYFDFHHTETDRIDAVNQRELELGAAAMTSLVYLIDKYGTEGN